ncbi:transcription factor MYB105 [Arabidopsis lyrata subsp. lyrata]|uniref:transcription factor MYB105 n=1 Tax=Arabidopsis lyrata subsp. lyrata TaxID=81972 RepID=UPI000A29A502|nr:transcription factor MYB105 [Arabidopsis lyrata subsp. lyrata]|eukprot:XP_020874175.1 transcription factor MYB105 [Arabidopsis lyrata subsp. lyrata]
MHHERQEKKFWTPSEDLKLTELVATYGARRWNRLAEKMQGRTGKGCRIRWLNKLDPRINKTAFTDEEDAKILSAQRELGNQWTKIAKLLHRRTDIARPSSNDFGEKNALVRGMHHERYKKKYWTPSEDLKLTRLVATYGPRRWKHIAEKMQVRVADSDGLISLIQGSTRQLSMMKKRQRYFQLKENWGTSGLRLLSFSIEELPMP